MASKRVHSGLSLRVILLAIIWLSSSAATAQASLVVPTHAMIAFVGIFSEASVIELVSAERFYLAVQFAIQVRNDAVIPIEVLLS